MSVTVGAQETIELSGQVVEITPSTSQPPPVAIRHPYFDAYIARNPAADPDPLEPTVGAQLQPVLNRLELASPWIRLLEKGEAEAYWERSDCGPQIGQQLCGLRWRKSGGFSDLRYRLGEVSNAMKAKVVGKALSEHLEVDIDSSPEIKFEWEWD